MIKTNINEFKKFNELLMSNAPPNYIPWYFPVISNNKAPDGLAIAKRIPNDYIGKRGNWKAKHARLTYDECIERLKNGGNVGLSARAYDDLVIVDIDDWHKLDTMPITLIVWSRKRCGIHGFFWKKDNWKKLNIPAEYGEVRASDQYVVACGSYCETSETDIKNQKLSKEFEERIRKENKIGLYSVKENIKPSYINFDGLPDFFKEQYNKVREAPEIKSNSIKPSGKHSALFDLKIEDIVSCNRNARVPHPLHSSDTGMNFSIDNGLGHCWRHNVSLNALQFLVVKSGYMSCMEAGTGHSGSGAGSSSIVRDDGAIFYAWLESKKSGLIPINDPIPVKAIHYIAKKHNLFCKTHNYKLPRRVYNLVLNIVKEKY